MATNKTKLNESNDNGTVGEYIRLGYHVRQVQLFLKVAVNVRGHYIGTHLPEINITWHLATFLTFSQPRSAVAPQTCLYTFVKCKMYIIVTISNANIYIWNSHQQVLIFIIILLYYAKVSCVFCLLKGK